MKFSKKAVEELKSFFNEINTSENFKALNKKDPFNSSALRKAYKEDVVFEFGLKAFLINLPNKYRIELPLPKNRRDFDVAIFCIYIGAPEEYLQRAFKILKDNIATLQQIETLGIPSLWFSELQEKDTTVKRSKYIDAFRSIEKKHKPKAATTKQAVNAPDPSLYYEKPDSEQPDNFKLCIQATLFTVAFLATSYIAYKNPKMFSALGTYFKNEITSKVSNFSIFSKYNNLFNSNLHLAT